MGQPSLITQVHYLNILSLAPGIFGLRKLLFIAKQESDYMTTYPRQVLTETVHGLSIDKNISEKYKYITVSWIDFMVTKTGTFSSSLEKELLR